MIRRSRLKANYSTLMTTVSTKASSRIDPTFFREVAPYTMPFILFAALTYLNDLAGFHPALGYAAKTFLVAVCLILFRKSYRPEIRVRFGFLDVLAGVLVFLIWIGFEGAYPLLASPSGFDPYAMSNGLAVATAFITIRLLGAVLVVPIMEELFWRSFAMRFLIDSKFKSIPLGRFTWFSFLMVSLAFGLEHHRWLPGIIAGLIFAGLLYRNKNLFSPILAHAVANLLLGLYVITTQHWQFW